jgi:hypothetical protein
MTPEQLILKHYGETTNPACPVVEHYGWIKQWKIAYELHRNKAGTIWGVQAVELLPDGTTKEVRQFRYAGSREENMKAWISGLITGVQSLDIE